MGIPIFILSFERLSVLKQSIDSYRRLLPEPVIVIHDTGSTYEPLLDYYEELKREGAQIYLNRKPVTTAADLNAIADTISDYFSSRPHSEYVVTDPDVAFTDECLSDALDFFSHMLATSPQTDVVGPMLRIDDIPDYYPLKSAVIQRHTRQFYHKVPHTVEWRGRIIGYQHAYIDSTFGLFRAGFPYRRPLPNGIRVYAPYWAHHLDWYLDPNDLTQDQQLYLQKASRVSHWGGGWFKDAMQPEFNPKTYTYKV